MFYLTFESFSHPHFTLCAIGMVSQTLTCYFCMAVGYTFCLNVKCLLTPYERALYDIYIGSGTLSGASAKCFSCLLVLCCAPLPAPHLLMLCTTALLSLALNWSRKIPPSSGSHVPKTVRLFSFFFLCWHCCDGNPKSCTC